MKVNRGCPHPEPAHCAVACSWHHHSAKQWPRALQSPPIWAQAGRIPASLAGPHGSRLVGCGVANSARAEAAPDLLSTADRGNLGWLLGRGWCFLRPRSRDRALRSLAFSRSLSFFSFFFCAGEERNQSPGAGRMITRGWRPASSLRGGAEAGGTQISHSPLAVTPWYRGETEAQRSAQGLGAAQDWAVSMGHSPNASSETPQGQGLLCRGH